LDLCLRDRGSNGGADSWAYSLAFKMGNYWTEIHKADGEEMKINGGCKSCYGAGNLAGTNAAIKKARTHNRFTTLLEYVQDHPGEQVPERQNQEG